MITKLPDAWRAEEKDFHDILYYKLSGYICADQLDQALPKWTQVDGNPKNKPDEDEDLIMLYWAGSASIVEADEISIGDWWRPLCDLDYPPTGESDD